MEYFVMLLDEITFIANINKLTPSNNYLLSKLFLDEKRRKKVQNFDVLY